MPWSIFLCCCYCTIPSTFILLQPRENCFPLPLFLFSCHRSVSLCLSGSSMWSALRFKLRNINVLLIMQFSSTHHSSFSWLLELWSGSFLHFPSFSLYVLPHPPLFSFFFFPSFFTAGRSWNLIFFDHPVSFRASDPPASRGHHPPQ